MNKNREKSVKTTLSNWREILAQEDVNSDNYLYEIVQIVESNCLAVENVNNIIQCAQNDETIIPITKEDIKLFLKNVETESKVMKEASLSKNLLKAARAEIKVEELTCKSIAELIKIRIINLKEEFVKQREINAKIRKQLEDELKKLAGGGKVKDNGKKGKEKKGKEVKKATQTLEEIYVDLHKNIDVKQEKEPNLFTADYNPPGKEITYYILLCRFYDLNLLEELGKLGVEVNLFVEIGEEYRKGYLEELHNEETILEEFWAPWLQSSALSEVLPQNTCYLKYIPSGGLSLEKNFNDFCGILMNIQNFKRQYKNYYKNVRFLNVAERRKANNLKIYRAKLDQIPNECITIAFLLDCLVEEVCGRLEKKVENKEVVTHGGVTQQIKYLLNKYDCKFREIPNEPKITKTIDLKYGNTVEYMTEGPVVDVTLRAFKKCSPANLFDLFPNEDKSNVLLYKYLFNKWANGGINRTVHELKQCVYSFLFQRKHYSTVIINRKPKNNDIKRLMFGENTTQPNISPNPFEGTDFSVIKENCFCKFYSAENCVCDLSQNFCTLSEELDPKTLIQMLKVCQDEYKHFDYKYFAPNDALLIRFHYNIDVNRINQEKWVNSLRSVNCFRDFCAFILPQDIDWFVGEENIYLKEKNDQELKLKDEQLKELMSGVVCNDDFIIPGSIKDKKTESAAPRTSKEKARRTSKEKNKKTSVNKSTSLAISKRASDPFTPKSFPPYDPNKTYPFEIYNLGPDFIRFIDEEIDFHSADGISVSIHKQKLDKLVYSFIISANNNNLIMHNILDEIFRCEKPFRFHINAANGTIMVFNEPFHEKNINSKHIITDTVQKSDPIDTIFNNPKMDKLKEAIKNQIPVFKIISSRLHKYQYVKRVKSPLVFPVGKILRRVLCKPVLFIRTKKQKSVLESKCLPYTNLIDNTLDLEFRATLSTGLLIKTGLTSQPFYLKQKYITKRNDLQGLDDESYRCFCRNGTLVKFLKDGTVKTYTSDKNITHYKYGCFSSNKRRMKQQKNILPIHFYINNLNKLQKRIRNMCNKYKNHLIDIADNYRFESSRLECRKLHKVYKLSKKLFGVTPIIPLLNYSIITSEGRQIEVKDNIVYDYEKKYRESVFNDYLLSETIIHREDGTSWLLNRNGEAVTQFPDGTRITTWFEEMEELSTECSTTETPSLDKYCQVSEDSFSVLYTADKPEEAFVLLGMNYKFEHPNYATVTYFFDDVTNIKMPDNIEVTISENNYSVNLLNDVINIEPNSLSFNACNINIAPLRTNFENPGSFLFIKDSTNRVFEVNYNGNISNYVTGTEKQSRLQERYFVINRDLSGTEMYHPPVPFNFQHTLNQNDQTINLEEQSCITIIQPLRKTYSEKLMMLYDLPILATTNEKKCIYNLWKLHDFDINTIISKRRPKYTFKRLINKLPNEIFDTLTDMLNMTLSGGKYNTPNTEIVEKLVQKEQQDNSVPVITKEPQVPLKSRTVKQLCDRYKKLIKKGEIPKYFETLKGVCFTTVEECSEGAMQTSIAIKAQDSPHETLQDAPEEVQVPYLPPETEYDPEEAQARLVPQELTIHLKPDSYVHDIEITSSGLRVVTEKDTKNYPFPLACPTIKHELNEVIAAKTNDSLITEKDTNKTGIAAETNDSLIKKDYLREARINARVAAGTNDSLITEKDTTKSELMETGIAAKTNDSLIIENNSNKPELIETGIAAETNDSLITSSVFQAPKKDTKDYFINSRVAAGTDDSLTTQFPHPKQQNPCVTPLPTPNDSKETLLTTFDELINQIEYKIKKKKVKKKNMGLSTKNVCKAHAPLSITCNNDTCMCPAPIPKTIGRKCNCKIGHCFCSELLNSESFKVYFPHDDYTGINFNKLAWTILQQFEDKKLKFNFLEEHAKEVITSAAKQLNMPKKEADSLIIALNEEIPLYPKKVDVSPHEDILEILQTIKNSIKTKGTKKYVPLDYTELEIISSSIHLAIIENRVGSTKSEIVTDLKQKLSEPELTAYQKLDVINAVSKKIIEERKQEISPESKFSITSNLFIEIINAVEKAIDELQKQKKPCCTKCGQDGGILKDQEDPCTNIDCKSKRKTKRPEIDEIFSKSDAALRPTSKEKLTKLKTRTSTNVSLKLKIDNEFRNMGMGDEIVKKAFETSASKETIKEEVMQKKIVHKALARPNIYDTKYHERK